MRQHSALNRGLMFEWLKDLDDTGDRCPSDAAIMERFDFDTPEQARTLLADLADKGLIIVNGSGADRVVTIRDESWTRPQPAPIERPVPSVVKQSASVVRGVAAIMRIVQGEPTAQPVAVPATFEPEPEPATLIVARGTGSPCPPRTEKPRGGRPPRGSTRLSRQINCRATEETYHLLQQRAAEEGLAATTLVGDIVAREMRDPRGATAPTHKPLIRAHVIRAARDAGIPVEEFVAGLIECGLQRFLADVTREIAA